VRPSDVNESSTINMRVLFHTAAPLPAEHQMIQELGVARATVREALRFLELRQPLWSSSEESAAFALRASGDRARGAAARAAHDAHSVAARVLRRARRGGQRQSRQPRASNARAEERGQQRRLCQPLIHEREKFAP
jgi:hypothetical protein